ncbi:MAG TPA: hypothetical protein VIY48_04640 [Candidatus Paceibacterota bacterium]
MEAYKIYAEWFAAAKRAGGVRKENIRGREEFLNEKGEVVAEWSAGKGEVYFA